MGTRPPLQVSVPGWSLATETRKAFEERVRREVENVLDEYARRTAEEMGGGPMGESETEITSPLPCPANPDNTLVPPVGILHRIFPDFRLQRVCRVSARYTPEHYDWLVKFQVQRRRWATIAKEASRQVGPGAVKTAVQRAAEAVCGEWYTNWLRKGDPGRPRNG